MAACHLPDRLVHRGRQFSCHGAGRLLPLIEQITSTVALELVELALCAPHSLGRRGHLVAQVDHVRLGRLELLAALLGELGVLGRIGVRDGSGGVLYLDLRRFELRLEVARLDRSAVACSCS
jgi:hypothetical protein